MNSSCIIPDIINASPKALVHLSYPSGVKVEPGKVLTPTQVKDQLTASWEAEDDTLYALFMLDVNPPSPVDCAILHWLVINITGNKVAEGQTVAEYIGSAPSKGTGLHNYVFLVFKQAGKIETTQFIPKTCRKGRISVKVKDYIAKYNLEYTIAENYYQAQYDDYVPILKAQFS